MHMPNERVECLESSLSDERGSISVPETKSEHKIPLKNNQKTDENIKKTKSSFHTQA